MLTRRIPWLLALPRVPRRTWREWRARCLRVREVGIAGAGELSASGCGAFVAELLVIRSLICCGFLALVCPRWSLCRRLCATVLFASSWEMLENSAFIIQRYRHATMSLHYLGDSIANSLGDIVSCGVGFVLARALGFRWSVVLFLVTEAVLLLWIRDDLLLNVIMLIYPVGAIKRWQAGG